MQKSELEAENERLRKELAETRCHGPRECANYLGMELRLYGAKALAETKLAASEARVRELKAPPEAVEEDFSAARAAADLHYERQEALRNETALGRIHTILEAAELRQDDGLLTQEQAVASIAEIRAVLDGVLPEDI